MDDGHLSFHMFNGMVNFVSVLCFALENDFKYPVSHSGFSIARLLMPVQNKLLTGDFTTWAKCSFFSIKSSVFVLVLYKSECNPCNREAEAPEIQKFEGT